MENQREPCSLPAAAVSVPATATAAAAAAPSASSALSKPAAAPAEAATPAVTATAPTRPSTAPVVQQTNTSAMTKASIPRATTLASFAPAPPVHFPVPGMNLPPSQLAMLSQTIVQHTLMHMPPPKAPPAPPAFWKQQKKRGRPIGSVDKMPRKKPAFVPNLKLPTTTRTDRAVELAVERRKKAQTKISKAQEAIKKAQQALEAAQEHAKLIDVAYDRAIERQAGAKLLAFEEVSKDHDREKKSNNTVENEFFWFEYYQSLKAFKEKEGHSHVKRRQNSNFELRVGNRFVKSLAR